MWRNEYLGLQEAVEHLTAKLQTTEGALESALLEAKETAERLMAANQKHENEKGDLLKAYHLEATQRAWCPPGWAELHPALGKECPLLVAATADARRRACLPNVRTMTSLAEKSAFRDPSLWALYWVVAHGAAAIRERLPEGINENGLTVAFVAALDDAAKEYRKLFAEAIDLEIGTGKLFEYTSENQQEVDTGADLVLVLSGKQLIPGGGARLLWVQAKKRSRTDNPWLLSYRQQNSKHGTQCAALMRRHDPARGSFGSYVNYAESVPFVAAVPVELLAANGTSANVAEVGIRLQEHVLSRITAANVGQFTSAEDVFDFLTDNDASSGTRRSKW
ncbi:MAG: hypothetical protein MZW92_36205 [Comamonadaceae bacterium]|nr:hypothetical protein [Comamonadaceae bacterium]